MSASDWELNEAIKQCVSLSVDMIKYPDKTTYKREFIAAYSVLAYSPFL